MSEDLDKYLELVKDQNRAIATLRHMMDRGYSIVHLPDKNQFGVRLNSGIWALCKYPTPKDSQEGIILFDYYDDAYQRAKELMWIDRDLAKKGDKIYKVSELSSLVRRITVKE